MLHKSLGKKLEALGSLVKGSPVWQTEAFLLEFQLEKDKPASRESVTRVFAEVFGKSEQHIDRCVRAINGGDQLIDEIAREAAKRNRH